MKKEIYWDKALKKTEISIRSNRLFPLETKDITSEIYAGNDFIIRKLDTSKFKKYSYIGPKINPFRPWDKILEIDSVGKHHHLILNKYPVQIGHLLLITNDWKEQNGWLDMDDWEAIKKVNLDTSGLWFFNSDSLAGASQPHRHIQLLRRGGIEKICPREKWLSEFNTKDLNKNKFKDNLIIKKISLSSKNENMYQIYLELTRKIGLGDPLIDIKPKHPYNLLFSNNWIVIVKRKTDNIQGISVNALGFAGYILVTKKSNISYLKNIGPEELLYNFI